MTEKNLWSKLALIVVLVGLCAWQVWPPKDKLKPGIDLGGGHSLLFEVDDSGLPAAQRVDLARRVMDILRQRVDPGGNRNLIWRPIGWNRIEIQMPRPPQHLARFRDEYNEARSALVDTTLTEAEIRSALALPVDQRPAALDRLVRGVPSRRPLVDKVLEAVNTYEQLKASTTQPSGETAQKMDETLSERVQLIQQLLDTNVRVQVLTDILALGANSQVRANKLATLKGQHPDLAPQIDAMVEKYDQWSTVKGALDDPADLMRMLRGAGKLEFRILAERDPANPGRVDSTSPEYREDVQKYLDQLQKFGPRPREGDAFRWFEIANPDENAIAEASQHYVVGDYLGRKYVVAYDVPGRCLVNRGDNAWQLRGAFEDIDRQGRPSVNFQLDNAGGNIFGEMTRTNLHRAMCIFLDEMAISAATIQSEITTSGQITGNFSRAEVANLVNTLNAGVLPARLKEVPLQQISIGPSLGQTNRAKGLRAITYAFLLTIAFMAIYYGYNGVVADIALLMNLVITLGIMSFLQATFTLPGLAGLVLMLGMAVDANVLIYERIREELQRGISVRMAVRLGYERAFSAILDSNVTTIITAVILGSLGSEEIKGFGLTLGIGLCSSLFTALFVTRQFFNVMVPNQLDSGETRRAWLGTGILAMLGGVFMAVGYLLFRTPQALNDSTIFAMGKFFGIMFATALVLMLCLWGFRILYGATGHQRAGRLPMMHLLSAPTFNWMSKYRFYWTFSAIIIIGGLIFEANTDKEQYLDIEFLGGTSVQVEVKPDLADRFAKRGDVELLNYIRGANQQQQNEPTTSVGWLRATAAQIAGATVQPAGENRYRITGYGDLTFTQIQALLLPTLEDKLVRGGITQADEGVEIQFSTVNDKAKALAADPQAVQTLVHSAADYIRGAADKLRKARVTIVEQQMENGTLRHAFEVVTTETQKDLVAEALLASMNNILDVTQPIDYKLERDPQRAPNGIFPIKQSANTLADVIGGTDNRSVAEYKGGVAVVFDDLQPAVTPAEIEQRLRNIRLLPEFADIPVREKSTAIPLKNVPGDPGRATRIAVLVADPSLPYVEDGDNTQWQGELAEPELKVAEAALAHTRALQRVTQFDKQVSGEAVQKAVIAILLSMIAIAIYLWIRFGSLEFGLAGIIALFHDVAVTLSAVMACHHLYNTGVGRLLLLDDFKINLALVAAFLTIVGYSINDTIVIFDRIRENRGRLATISSQLINDSINQTLSRTIITSFTTLMVVVVMYAIGGGGIHGFAFAMTVGMISGTYSTLAIATPMLNNPRALWVTTIALATLAALGIVSMIGMPTLRIALMVVIAIVALAAFVRQWKVTAPLTGRAATA